MNVGETRPIRILRIIARMNVGGPAWQVSVLTRGLDEHRFESRLVVGNWLCNAPNDLQAALPTIDTVPPAYCSKKPARGVMITAWR